MTENMSTALELDAPRNCIVRLAQQYATRHHNGQLRRGLAPPHLPYIVHPANVVKLLQNYGVTDPTTLATGWLHDTVEDTEATHEDIRQVFGPNIAYSVYILTRNVSRAEYKKRLESAPDNIKLVKLCDQLDNLRTMECLTPEGIARKIEDTETFYIPLARKIYPDIASRMRRCLDMYFERIIS